MTDGGKRSTRWSDDPLVRVLRAISAVAFLILFALVVLDPARGDFATKSLLAGAVLVQLGYEVVLKFPEFVTRNKRDDGDD